MLFVALERNRIRDFIRHGIDLDRQIELDQRGHDRLVKIRYAPRFQFDRSLSSVAFQNSKPMIDKVETNLESIGAVRNWRSGQSAGSDIKRDVPRMVGPRRLHEA